MALERGYCGELVVLAFLKGIFLPTLCTPPSALGKPLIRRCGAVFSLLQRWQHYVAVPVIGLFDLLPLFVIRSSWHRITLSNNPTVALFEVSSFVFSFNFLDVLEPLPEILLWSHRQARCIAFSIIRQLHVEACNVVNLSDAGTACMDSVQDIPSGITEMCYFDRTHILDTFFEKLGSCQQQSFLAEIFQM